MSKFKTLIKDTKGDALVEAAILFPIMIMIFAAIVLLSMYLPQRAVLHNAAQYTATVLAREHSDTGYFFVHDDDEGFKEEWDFKLHNNIIDATLGRMFEVYNKRNNFWYRAFGWFLLDDDDFKGRAQDIVDLIVNRSIRMSGSDVEVELAVDKTLLSTSFTVVVEQTITFPVDLSFIYFPTSMTLKQSACCIVADGDAFIRNVDDAYAFADIATRGKDVLHDIQPQNILEDLSLFLKTVVGLE